MTKQTERLEARRLRSEDGWAITDIAKHLCVSKSSVSVWVRDIKLTPQQLEAIKMQHYAYGAQHKGSQANIRKHRELRLAYQEEGRRKAREGDSLHLAGCMLYWAEGRKSRSNVTFSNSDTDMVLYFVRFLREQLGLADNDLVLRLHCYTNNGLTLEQIEGFWLDLLDLTSLNLRKANVWKPTSSQQKGRKLLYGVCDVSFYNVEIAQHIFGAIQEYIGVDKPE